MKPPLLPGWSGLRVGQPEKKKGGSGRYIDGAMDLNYSIRLKESPEGGGVFHLRLLAC
jgi:hypothetical protein